MSVTNSLYSMSSSLRYLSMAYKGFCSSNYETELQCQFCPVVCAAEFTTQLCLHILINLDLFNVFC